MEEITHSPYITGLTVGNYVDGNPTVSITASTAHGDVYAIVEYIKE